MNKYMKKTFLFSLFAVFIFANCFFLSGCIFRPYHVDVQQGNIMNQPDLSKIQIGMTKNQIQSILGTPMLRSSFERDTWTYAYTNQINGGKIEKKEVTLYFSDDELIKIEK
jgi:outer membrane protein assembly factor BamE